MRKKFKVPNWGDERIVEKFLWFPAIIDHELRWLETAKIKQIYYLGWKNLMFLNE